MAVVWIGIGSNLGDRELALSEAVARLRNEGFCLLESGKIYETEPWGMEGVPYFLNQIVKMQIDIGPTELVDKMQEIEVGMGRTRTGNGYSSRVIDLDILFWEGLVWSAPKLIIPHPGAHLRKFVLMPMCELDSEMIHPVLGKTMSQLLNDCKDPGECRLYHNTVI